MGYFVGISPPTRPILLGHSPGEMTMLQLISMILTAMGLYNSYRTVKDFIKNFFPKAKPKKRAVLNTVYNKKTGRYETYVDAHKSINAEIRQTLKEIFASLKSYASVLVRKLIMKFKRFVPGLPSGN
jgi:hypothetical protein